MEAYKTFAEVYDVLMSNINYKSWAKYIAEIWKRYNLCPDLVLDLGCGTGELSILLSEMGCDVIGVDKSPEMLSVASEKAKSKDMDILFLNQDMENFELYGTVDSIICACDSINYIVRKDKLFKTFRLVKNYLNPGGIFIFDINTRYKYEKILGDNTFAETFDKASYIWENCYNKKNRINEYALTLFLERDDAKYERTIEYHYQRAYGIKELHSLLEQAYLKTVGVYDGYTFREPRKKSERIVFVCEKEGVSNG